ncbi:trace amine-associated receptor 4-like [Protopterus annectens]|uniref:trace amine-associated receptor 4-like n=1 Tax=Protopterus annectens TaxID=7888 RepID=UPI001CFB00C3|nr:trace amine-associated receptor 4-like [Protopterus annectens]
MNMTSYQSLDAIQYCFPSVKGSCIRNSLPATAKVVLYTLVVGLITVVVSGNLLVIISVAHFRQLHSPTNYLTLSLAVTDLFVGLLVLPFSMVRSIETCWYFGNTFCKIHSTFDIAVTSVSVFHLCFIAIDRYFAVCDPLRYSSTITFSVTAIFVTICWAVPASFSSFIIFTGKNSTNNILTSGYCEGFCMIIFDEVWGITSPLVTFFLPDSIMIVIYVKVFVVASSHAKVISSITDRKTSVKKQHAKSMKEANKKAIKTLALIMGAFVMCWLPCMVILMISICFNDLIPTVVFEIVNWLAYFNSACNPMIYGLFYPWFRRAFKTILTGKIFRIASSTTNLFPEHD